MHCGIAVVCFAIFFVWKLELEQEVVAQGRLIAVIAAT
jgi:hypothetical protein